MLLCWWCWPYHAEGQPCLLDQHLAVQLWTAPASHGRPLIGQDWEDPKEVPVRCCQTSVGNKAGQDCQVIGIYMVYTWYIHGIYHVYPGCEWNISFVYIQVVVLCYHAVCMYFQFFQLSLLPCNCAKIKDYSKWNMPCIYMVYTCIYQVYTMKLCCITFTENYAVLKSYVFYIRLPLTMARVYCIETPRNT